MEYLTPNFQKQSCHDIDECSSGMAYCPKNSVCVNTIVSIIGQ